MRQLLYAMQFKGQAGPGDKEGTMFAKTTSDSCRITSSVSDAGLEGTLEPVAGGRASFESVVTITGESSFLESGSIHFGRAEGLQQNFVSIPNQNRIPALPSATRTFTESEKKPQLKSGRMWQRCGSVKTNLP